MNLPENVGSAIELAGQMGLEDVVGFIGSGVLDAVTAYAPIVVPVTILLQDIHSLCKAATQCREELANLGNECAYVGTHIVNAWLKSPLQESGMRELRSKLEGVKELTERISSRTFIGAMFNAERDRQAIEETRIGIRRLLTVMGLGATIQGVTIIENRMDDLMRVFLEVQNTLNNCSGPAPINRPRNVPVAKIWHIERAEKMEALRRAVFSAAAGEGGGRLVVLAGNSGAGKTTMASTFVNRQDVRRKFDNGVLWLKEGKDLEQRLPTTVLRSFAGGLYNIEGGDRNLPLPPEFKDVEEAHEYIEQLKVDLEGHLRHLLVVDDVWNPEVAVELRRTGLPVLITCRDTELVDTERDAVVKLGALTMSEAVRVLKLAAEINEDDQLPPSAMELIQRCSNRAMDLAFVGRWGEVKGEVDELAWRYVIRKIDAQRNNIAGSHGHDPQAAVVFSRISILRAGIEELPVAQRNLYKSLAVMPKSSVFSSRDVAVLMFGKVRAREEPTRRKAQTTVDSLEGWGILALQEGLSSDGHPIYRMHDDHLEFARERLQKENSLKNKTLKLWTKYMLSLEAVKSMDLLTLCERWHTIHEVGHVPEKRRYQHMLEKTADTDKCRQDTLERIRDIYSLMGEDDAASEVQKMIKELPEGTQGRQSQPRSLLKRITLSKIKASKRG